MNHDIDYANLKLQNLNNSPIDNPTSKPAKSTLSPFCILCSSMARRIAIGMVEDTVLPPSRKEI
jgi:hypothetical protein